MIHSPTTTSLPATKGITALPAHEVEGLMITCDAIGNIIEFWGFRRVLGRIWTLLYLSSQPLSAQDIGDRLDLSAGSVNMSLHEMEHWGLLVRERYAGRTGQRGAVFRAETQIWKIVGRVICNRELHQLDRLKQDLQEGIDKFKMTRISQRNTLAIHRLERLLAIVSIGREVFELAFGSSSWDLRSLERLSRLRQLFQKN